MITFGLKVHNLLKDNKFCIFDNINYMTIFSNGLEYL